MATNMTNVTSDWMKQSINLLAQLHCKAVLAEMQCDYALANQLYHHQEAWKEMNQK